MCIAASKRFQCYSVGCEVEESLILKFIEKIRTESNSMPILKNIVKVVHGDLRELDISAAAVIVIYLLPESIVLINEMLIRAIHNGTVLICNSVSSNLNYHIKNWINFP